MQDGGRNDLLDRLSDDPAFAHVDTATMKAELDATRYTGRAPEQVREFVEGVLDPLLVSLNSYAVSDPATVTV